MARMYRRKEGQSLYSEGTQTRLELSRNYHMQYLLLKLTVVHDNESNAKFVDDEIFSVINQLELVANGNNTLKQIPSKKLYVDNLTGTTQRGMFKVDKTAGTDKESYVYAVIPFSMFNTIRPTDTILNTRIFTTFELLVNWNSKTSLGTGITVKSAKLDVWSDSLVGYKRNAGESIKYFKSISQSKEITSTTPEFQITLPNQKIYKQIAIVATADNKRTDDIVKGIKIKSGTTVILEMDAEALRATNIFEFRPENNGLMKGIYVIDFAVRGRLSDLVNTKNPEFNQFDLILDVEKQSGKNYVHVLTDEVVDTNIIEK